MSLIFLRYRLWRLGRRAKPDRVFANNLKRVLAERGFFPEAKPVIGARWKMAFASAGAFGSLFMGTVGYAWASDNVLPDHALYPIREEVERVELALAKTPEKKEEVRLQHLDRRVRELKLMQQKKKRVPPRHVERVVGEMRAAASQIEKEDDADELKEAIRLDAQNADEIARERKAVKTDEEREALDGILTKQAERVRNGVIQLKQTRRDRQSLKQKQVVPPAATSTPVILLPTTSTPAVTNRKAEPSKSKPKLKQLPIPAKRPAKKIPAR